MSIAYSDLSRPVRVLILAYGMPGSPSNTNDSFVRRFVSRGFVVAIPEYIGTYDSYGACNFENCVDALLETIKLFRKGKAKDLITMEALRWKVKELVLVGGSFGACMALIAGAKSKQVKKIVSIAAPTDYGDIGSEEESVLDDYRVMKRAFPNTWRFASKKAWADLNKGLLDVNAVDYAKSLRGKDVLLIHGVKDKAVNFKRSTQLYSMIKGGKGKKGLLLLEKEGHIGLRALRKSRIFNKVIGFLE
jgi:esterase/lipase